MCDIFASDSNESELVSIEKQTNKKITKLLKVFSKICINQIYKRAKCARIRWLALRNLYGSWTDF